ncbi:MAG: UDP-N-acetylmuramoyl-L-alanyl-D-glutamate--2,6-diaminopimelate ligase [Arachnia sp.]
MTAVRPTTATPVGLTDLVAGLDLTTELPAAPRITGVGLDSRQMAPGWLYFALPGERVHGAAFAEQAVAAGAVAILTDEAGAALAAATGVPTLVSSRLRRDMAEVSARFFGRPAMALELFGVTGTNGKTTTVALLDAGLRSAGRSSATIGTLGFRLNGAALASTRSTVTTPDSPDLQALLAVMGQAGATSVSIEVSSHALAFERVAGLRFAVVGFLNLGRDHLDFHRDLDDYFDAKARLFTSEYADAAVIWTDDDHGRRLVQRAREQGVSRIVTVGTTDDADYRLTSYRPDGPLGGHAVVRRGGEELTLTSRLPGRYNAIDTVVALAMLETAGYEADSVLAGLMSATVPGRMEPLELPGEAPSVVVDFAHTPQAVDAALAALEGGFGQMIAVLGCGGDRDAAKRPAMGAAAAGWADIVIITDDNPRSEDPALIREAAFRGALDAAAQRDPAPLVLNIAGRGNAIERALEESSAASVVAILGKGHETGQHMGDRVIDFDDAVEVRRAWERLRGGIDAAT